MHTVQLRTRHSDQEFLGYKVKLSVMDISADSVVADQTKHLFRLSAGLIVWIIEQPPFKSHAVSLIH